MLALQPVNHIEPLLQFRNAPRIVFRFFNYGFEFPGQILKLQQKAVQTVINAAHTGIITANLGQRLEKVPRLIDQGRIAFVELLERITQRLFDFLRIGEYRQFFLQLFLLPGAELRLLKFFKLELDELYLPGRIFIALDKSCQGAKTGLKFLKSPLVLGQQILIAGKRIQHAQLKTHLMNIKIVKLLVQIDQRRTELLKYLQVNWRVIDESTRFARRQ